MKKVIYYQVRYKNTTSDMPLSYLYDNYEDAEHELQKQIEEIKAIWATPHIYGLYIQRFVLNEVYTIEEVIKNENIRTDTNIYWHFKNRYQ